MWGVNTENTETFLMFVIIRVETGAACVAQERKNKYPFK